MKLWQMWQRIRAWFRRLPARVRAALHTAWVTLVATLAPAVFGFLADLENWAAGGDTVPNLSILGRAAASAVVAAVAFLINFAFRTVFPVENAYRPHVKEE